MRMLVVKPQRSLGEQIGPVKIIEREAPDDWYTQQGIISLFDIFTADGTCRRGFLRDLDSAIGFCHQNLISIESIERLTEN